MKFICFGKIKGMSPYCVEKLYISTFNLLIQGQEKEQRRDLKGDDVDPTLAGKGALLDLRSLSFILINICLCDL